jgi:hypothetical protein
MMGWPVRQIAFFRLQKGARNWSQTGWQDSQLIATAIRRDFRFGSLAEVEWRPALVRFFPQKQTLEQVARKKCHRQVIDRRLIQTQTP